MHNCKWCGIDFANGEIAYNGLYHYQQICVNGNYICIKCYNKYISAVENYRNMYIEYKSTKEIIPCHCFGIDRLVDGLNDIIESYPSEDAMLDCAKNLIANGCNN